MILSCWLLKTIEKIAMESSSLRKNYEERYIGNWIYFFHFSVCSFFWFFIQKKSNNFWIVVFELGWWSRAPLIKWYPRLKITQISTFIDFTKTQKTRYLENKTLFFLQITKFINYQQGLPYGKKYFCSGSNL